MNYERLIEQVESQVKENGRHEITGLIVQSVILAVIRELGMGYQFAGVADSETEPPITDARIFYICGAGDYSHFGEGFSVEEGSIGILVFNTEWQLRSVAICETSQGINMSVETFNNTSLQAEVGKYYIATADVNNLTVTLPAITDLTKTKSIMVNFVAGPTPNIKFVSADSKPISFYDGYSIELGAEYELNIMFNGVKWVITSWTVKDHHDNLKFTVNEGSPSGTITLTIPSGLTQEECTNIEYSLDGRTWVTFVNQGRGLTITTPILNAGDSVYFRGQATLISKSTSVFSHFSTSSSDFKISASGSIMSLLGGGKILTDYAFGRLFHSCTSLTTAPEFPATILADSCYSNIFNGCTNLTTAPELPVTTLATGCYNNMFYGCTSLTTAPVLPATTLASNCYKAMFSHCSSLTTAPVLPATTLADSCYHNMFHGCTGLTTAPVLPATTLATGCYNNMFYDCTGLTIAPELPATTLVSGCYEGMFHGCTSLITAPELLATTLADSCYRSMFSGCNQLNKVTMLATDISASDCLAFWMEGVAAQGTFYKNPAMTTLPTGVSGIPEGWIVIDKAI